LISRHTQRAHFTLHASARLYDWSHYILIHR
jgi:hypothetical protein